MNDCYVSGRLVSDPVTRVVGNKKVVNLSIAVKDAGKNNTTSYLDISAWDKTAEIIVEHFVKGSVLSVRGRLKQDKFTTKDGKEVNKVNIVAQEVINVPARSENNSAPAEEYAF